MPRNSGVRRAYGVVTPGTCSANVRRLQEALSQKNRLIRRFSSVCLPPMAGSARVRW
jgi:hypothetical protein